jgi:hypothetical protein
MRHKILSVLELPLAFGLFIRSFSDALATVMATRIQESTVDELSYGGLTFQREPLFYNAKLPENMYYVFAIVCGYWAFVFGKVGVAIMSHKEILFTPVGYLGIANLLVVFWFAGSYLATAIAHTFNNR